MNDKTLPHSAKRNQIAGELRLVHSDKGSSRPPETASPDATPTQARLAHLRAELHQQVFLNDTALAAAIAVAHSDGAIDLSIIGVEPEQANQLADGLERLANRLRSHASLRPNLRKSRGAVVSSLACMLAFAALAYFNDVAWIDAVLSIAAQVASTYFERFRPTPRRSHPHTDL